MLEYLFFRALGSATAHVPPRLGYWGASRLGGLAYYLNTRGAQSLKGNLRRVLGPAASKGMIEDTARQVFSHLLMNYYELFHNYALTDDEVFASITVNGLSHLLDAVDEGNGVVLTTAHFGLFDALWVIGPGLDLKITAPAEHLQPEKLYQYVCKLRGRNWINFLPVDSLLLGLVRALRRGEIVVVAADRDITRSGVLVDFFGAPARLPDGHVQLALRTGAKLVTCFGLRLPGGRAALQIEPALALQRTGDLELDVQVNVGKVVARMQRWISRHPEQWLMLHPVWEDGRDAA